ncbi:MAG: AmmeMemoRadiSam system protein B [Candidatus Moranbacteria bacterium]|nr:AmmeMemoRadiSam system protein B [Candidatus Moranbacteria bacterium]
MLIFSAITPHPPIIIPEIGSEGDLRQVKGTMDAMKQLSGELKKEDPDTIIIVSPHALLHPEAFGINESDSLKGDMSQFGFEKKFLFDNDLELVEKIKKEATEKDLQINSFQEKLDHGALVPLYFLTEGIQPKIIHLAFSLQSREKHYQLGEIIRKICGDTNEKIAFIASGDLSHRLSPFAPAGYSPQGKIFDDQLIEHLEKADVDGVINMNNQLIEDAGECGYRSILILLGMVGKDFHFDKKSYEGPFGVGYLAARTS